MKFAYLKLFIPLTFGPMVSGCSSLSEALLPQQEQSPGPGTRQERISSATSNQFQWGLQYFEAGDYQKALAIFQELEKQGPVFEEVDRLPFYQGMSQFYLGQRDSAERTLLKFLSATPEGREAQEARLKLLHIFEGNKAWKRLLSLAAETEKGPLFQLQRANLKLLWGLALIETGELKAAAVQFKDAQSVLEPTAREDASSRETDPHLDLWGRFYFSELRLLQANCAFGPKTVGSGKKAKKLLGPWLEGRSECLIKFVNEATSGLWSKEGFWAERAHGLFLEMVDSWGREGRAEIDALKSNIRLQQSTRGLWQQASYRVISRIDASIKIFEIQGVEARPLKEARKRLDLLIVRNSSPSS